MTQDHVALIQTDGRGRISVARWLTKGVKYKVFTEPDGSLRLVPSAVSE